MSPITNTFFITGLGRSGTKFLATTLKRSRQFNVVHEWKIKRTPFRDANLKNFPLYRFWLARHPFPSSRKGYGEVNSHLRYVLQPSEVGPEARIPKRGIIERDPRDVIASAMNRRNNTMDDFSEICDRVVYDYIKLQKILRLSGLQYDRFSFLKMTRDPEYLQRIVEWTGISDIQISESDTTRKVNQNTVSWFPRYAEWDQEQLDVFQRAVAEYGSGDSFPLLEDD